MAKKQKNNPKPISTSIPKEHTIENLTTIAEKRTGGAVNITGIIFQTLYATHALLQEFSDSQSGTSIRLEGLEDIDLDKGKLKIIDKVLIQLKTSTNSLDAAGFWSMDVLKNFLEVHLLDKDLKFRFVYNMPIAAGHLQKLIEGKLNEVSKAHWHEKIKMLKLYRADLDIDKFLNQISFEKISAENLYKQSVALLLSKHNINSGTEVQYLKSIFFHALEWSKERVVIDKILFNQTLQQVTDAFYKGPINPAVVNGWITPETFQTSKDVSIDDYFEGKSARPEHILQKLPARRPVWEKYIGEQLKKSDVVVIKSSSGQGKSTLAWQIAYDLLGNCSVYQLNHAQLAEYTEPIIDFVKSRVHIGESPLVIIDGLDQQLRYWSLIVVRLQALPVKFIITTREEDWYTFSNDISKINLQVASISLTEDEARNIYQQLKAKNKIHADAKNWQTPWEKVKERGLLIEYTYLLTKGEMISERLSHQIKKLNFGERNSGAKIEILRMISAADILGLKLKSKELIAHVQKVAGITGDRGELLKELEQEYFVRLEDEYVEGLHPVRSAHLVKLLHDFVMIEETLTGLLLLLEPLYYRQFANGAPNLVDEKKRSSFLKELALIIAQKDINHMVRLIDGLMQREPQRYWEANRGIFEEAYQSGGIELFVMDTLPFTKLKMLEMLQRSVGDEFKNPSVLQQKLESLPEYKFQESEVAQFIRHLRDSLTSRTIVERQGLANLVKWFNKIDDNPELQLEITEADLRDAMKPSGLEAAHEIFYYFRRTYAERYKRFVTDYRKEILSWLKTETDTLTVDEKDDDLYLTYIYDAEGEKVNEQSVRRIEWFYNFLQDYQVYCTDIVYLPFPTDEMYKVIKMDAHKTISPENLFDPFESRINRSWSDTIMKNYEAESVYEWQSNLIKIRKTALDFVKRCTQFFEFLIEKNEQRKRAAVNPLINVGEETLKLIRTQKQYPDKALRMEESVFKIPYKQIEEWILGLQNFINQFSRIILGQEGRHIALINLKKMVMELEPAQKSFSAIAGQNYQYFNLSELQSEEVDWYSRLRATAEYFEKFRDQTVSSAKQVIKEWWQQDQVELLYLLTEGLRVVSEPTDFIFRSPKSLKEDEYGKKAVISVEGLSDDPKAREEQMFPMIYSLIPLAALDIMTYDIVMITGSVARGAIRVQKTYLEQLLNAIDTGQFEASEFGNPIPINLDAESLEYLPGISMPDVSALNITQDFSKALMGLWAFQQQRSNIDKTQTTETTWLNQLSIKCQDMLNDCLLRIKASSESDFLIMKDMIDQVLTNEHDLENEVYLNVLAKKVEEVNKVISKSAANGDW